MKRIAVLASGGGSNLQAIIDRFAVLGPNAPGKIVLVASDRDNAGALARARTAGVDAVVLRDARDPDNSELESLLVDRRIDLVALAGFLRLIPAGVVNRFAGRIVNVHPALLPNHGGHGMYGQRVHQAVIDAGDTISGATIHLVTHEYDKGPILAQWSVPVLPSDDAHTLAERVLIAEHALYPRALEMLTAEQTDRFPVLPPVAYAPPITRADLDRDISAAFTNLA